MARRNRGRPAPPVPQQGLFYFSTHNFLRPHTGVRQSGHPTRPTKESTPGYASAHSAGNLQLARRRWHGWTPVLSRCCCAQERPLANTRPRKQSQEGEHAAVDAPPPNLNSIAGKGFWEEVRPTQLTPPTARSIGHAPPAVPPLTPRLWTRAHRVPLNPIWVSPYKRARPHEARVGSHCREGPVPPSKTQPTPGRHDQDFVPQLRS